MNFDFEKIKLNIKKTLNTTSEKIKALVVSTKEKFQMAKQKKKSLNKKSKDNKKPAQKTKTITKKSSNKDDSKRKTVRVVKLRKSNTRIIAGRIFWVVFIVALIFAGIYCYKLTNNFILDRNNTDIPALVGEINENNGMKINIPRGSRTSDIAEILIETQVISDAKILNYTYFELFSKLMGNDGGYKSGNHWINKNLDYDNPIGYDMLIHIFSQNPIPNPTATIFFPEGLTLDQTVDKFTDKGFLNKEKFLKTAEEYDFGYAFLDEIPNNGRYNRLEGYLFPDTYIFDMTKPEEEAIDKMLANFEKKFKDAYKERLEVLDMTMDEIIIIASLIEKEAQVDSERETIAGVIYNRLNTTDTSLNYLQIDATIQYHFINKTGTTKDPLLTEDTKIDIPYNTYMYPGLPIGPISNPGERSIIAALFPDKHNYFYYVAKGDGSHAFARTLQEHNNNKIKYQGN